MSVAARRVFITGASSGIGYALAQRYAHTGAHVGLVARRAGVLDDLARSLAPHASAYHADVRDAAALRAAAERFMTQVGLPDIVIANAGVSHGTLAGEANDLSTLQDIFDINLIGMAKTFQPFIEPLARAGCGTLVGIASVAGIRGLPGAGAYSASKAAAINYLESLRVELEPCGLSVVTLLPGYIDTPMTQGNPYPMPFIISAEDAAKRMTRAIALGRKRAVIPWPMAIVAQVLRWLPVPIYDTLLRNAPRKPRRGDP